jgi:hypothetical protein
MKPLFAVIVLGVGSFAVAGDVKPVSLTLEDQFGESQDVSKHGGKVLVLIYGDRKATDDCRSLGESLHIAFHPTAKGKAPKDARQAPVAPLPNLPVGIASPDVFVVPVACTGVIPGVVKTVLQKQIKSASPDVPVWLDCAAAMQTTFGLTTGEPNIAVLDAKCRARLVVNGKADQAKLKEVVQVIQDLRAEAVK